MVPSLVTPEHCVQCQWPIINALCLSSRRTAPHYSFYSPFIVNTHNVVHTPNSWRIQNNNELRSPPTHIFDSLASISIITSFIAVDRQLDVYNTQKFIWIYYSVQAQRWTNWADRRKKYKSRRISDRPTTKKLCECNRIWLIFNYAFYSSYAHFYFLPLSRSRIESSWMGI